MLKCSSNKPKNHPKAKEISPLQDKNPKRSPKHQIPPESYKLHLDPSISKKMEEKYIYTIKRTSVERSSSMKSTKKRKTEKLIEEEYRVNRVKITRKQEITVENKEEECMELRCNSRESYKNLEKPPPAPRLRLLRARSNDSFSKVQANIAKQEEVDKKLKELKDQNVILKQAHSQSQKRIELLQKQQFQEKTNFQGEQKVYERQIEALRNKIDRNKVDIGHLFSYQSFDPMKLLVQPIIEVEQQSSILRSLYNTSRHSDLKKKEQQCQYGLFQKLGKKNPTETTCLPSLEDYRDVSEFF